MKNTSRSFASTLTLGTSWPAATLYKSTSHLWVLDFTMKPLVQNSLGLGKNILSPCHSLKMGSVTTLSLQLTHPSLQYDISGFKTVLSGMPDLVDLFLGNALASAGNFISSVEFDTLKRIDLLCLSWLLVIAPLSTIITFLSSINILVHTQIRLHLSDLGEYPSCDNYSWFCSALAQYIAVIRCHLSQSSTWQL